MNRFEGVAEFYKRANHIEKWFEVLEQDSGDEQHVCDYCTAIERPSSEEVKVVTDCQHCQIVVVW